jgi:carbamoylphosphate synthase large subunit
MVLSVNPWFSRMSAFCAKAFGIDLATINAHLCLGAALDRALAGEAPISRQ